jgi:hypothetical protein
MSQVKGQILTSIFYIEIFNVEAAEKSADDCQTKEEIWFGK